MLTKSCTETIQVTDISANRVDTNEVGRLTSISGQKLLLAKGLTHELALCTGVQSLLPCLSRCIN